MTGKKKGKKNTRKSEGVTIRSEVERQGGRRGKCGTDVIKTYGKKKRSGKDEGERGDY